MFKCPLRNGGRGHGQLVSCSTHQRGENFTEIVKCACAATAKIENGRTRPHIKGTQKAKVAQGARLGLVELPEADDRGGPFGREVERVDECGVAVVVHAHGATLVHAHQQRPERVVQQRSHAAALKVHRRHVLPQPRVAAHRPVPCTNLKVKQNCQFAWSILLKAHCMCIQCTKIGDSMC